MNSLEQDTLRAKLRIRNMGLESSFHPEPVQTLSFYVPTSCSVKGSSHSYHSGLGRYDEALMKWLVDARLSGTFAASHRKRHRTWQSERGERGLKKTELWV